MTVGAALTQPAAEGLPGRVALVLHIRRVGLGVAGMLLGFAVWWVLTTVLLAGSRMAAAFAP
jgi:hypothetical protein